jgi:hypothetical protein
MTDLSQDAIDAGTEGVLAYRRATRAIDQTTRAMTVAVLEAAAPHIAATERERIRQGLDTIAKLYADAGIKDARPVLNDVRALLTEGDTT